MKTLTGKFTFPEGEPTNGKPAAKAVLDLRLSCGSTVRSTGEKVEGDEPIYIELDENGEIQEGTEVWGNDELDGETYYSLWGYHQDWYGEFCGTEKLVISGTSPVDLMRSWLHHCRRRPKRLHPSPRVRSLHYGNPAPITWVFSEV